jgi:hypothetical protein
LRYYATSRKVAGSSSDEVGGGGKGRPARKADNLTAIDEPIVKTKCGSVDLSQPYGPSRPVTGRLHDKFICPDVRIISV